MTTPEERLCSRSWRVRNSAWLLWPALSLGILTSVGVLRIGLKTKQRSWLIFGALYGAWTVCFFVSSNFVEPGTKANPSNSVGSNILYSAMLALWLLGMVHCFDLNRSWLRWRAANPKGQTAWYASGAAVPAQSVTPSRQPAQDAAETLSALYRGEASGSPTPVTSSADFNTVPVDLNTAALAELAAVGIDNVWAERIVAARARLGEFSATDQLMTEAGVPPHVYAAMRGRVRVAPSPSAPRNAPVSGGGRRLDF
jgi:DNA uptake protein ComE-like DNA-binding protein